MRVERLQSITEEDAIAEGATRRGDQCSKPMDLKAISEHWCFFCDALFLGWECPDCRIRTRTGCPHVEAEPPVKMPTADEFREGLGAVFEGL